MVARAPLGLGSPTNRRSRSAAVPSSPRNFEEEAEPASVVVQ